MIYGYARVSTDSQNLDLQVSALKDCDYIYTEIVSGLKKQRPELEKLISVLKPGDTIKVYKLDRLGRSVIELIKLIELFFNKDVEFVSITDNIDTTTAMGQLIFTILAGFAEFERNLISERTKAGLKAAKERGVTLGQPIKYDAETIRNVIKLKKQKITNKYIAEKLNLTIRAVNYIIDTYK